MTFYSKLKTALYSYIVGLNSASRFAQGEA